MSNDFIDALAASYDRVDDDAAVQTVVEVVPPRCCACDRTLVSRTELNRRIDWAMDICDPCIEGPDPDDECWCSYGFYRGGDPRQFEPDQENPDAEIAAWRAQCAAWERGEQSEPPAEEHGPWIDPDTAEVTIGERPSPESIGMCSVVRSFGLGATYCNRHTAPLDAWKSWPLNHAELAGPDPDAHGAGEREGA